MNIPEEAIAAFQEAWEAKRKEIGRGISPKGTKTRAGLEAALPYIRSQIAADMRAGHGPTGGHNPECHCGITAGANPRCTGCTSNWPCATEQAARIAEEGTTK